jgi:mannitol 2-dehydrogenase
LDLHDVHEAMAHPLVAGLLDKIEREEILPVVPPVPGTDLEDYLATIQARFANPDVGDTVARLCFDGSNRQPKFILPSTRDRLARGLPVTGLALESALWCRYLAGESESGAPIALDDVHAERLQAAARAARRDPAAFLGLGDIFGDLADDTTFRTAFATALTALWRDGVASTLERYLALPPGAPLR